MNFDQMLEAWKAQDDKPLYGVNRDLLQLVLQNEQASMRRGLRWEIWTTSVVVAGMAAWTAFWLWVLVYTDGPLLQVIAAALGTGLLAGSLGAVWLSRRRQVWRERSFGSTLQAEVRRNLSLVEYQLDRYGRWQGAMLWTAPIIAGAGLLSWLVVEINLDPGESRWDQAWMWIVLLWAALIQPFASSRAVRRKLEPRRQRLRELLETLDAGE
jgi:hypothetical protein